MSETSRQTGDKKFVSVLPNQSYGSTADFSFKAVNLALFKSKKLFSSFYVSFFCIDFYLHLFHKQYLNSKIRAVSVTLNFT